VVFIKSPIAIIIYAIAQIAILIRRPCIACIHDITSYTFLLPRLDAGALTAGGNLSREPFIYAPITILIDAITIAIFTLLRTGLTQ
jgi:hypothetical protein